MIPTDRLMTPREAAAAFGVSAKTVTRWEKAGLLHSARTLGGHRRYDRKEVHQLMREKGISNAEASDAKAGSTCGASH